MLKFPAMQVNCIAGSYNKECILDNYQTLEQFLKSVERKAFKMAEIAVGNREEALDIVQDTMLTLVQKYATKPSEEWTPLFYKILQSRIRDWYRRHKIRSKWVSLLNFRKSEDDHDSENLIDALADPVAREPSQTVANECSINTLEVAIHALPLRQQQAFLLRSWEGLSVAETASAMGCSQGSIKTHYSRALHTLRSTLEDHWP